MNSPDPGVYARIPIADLTIAEAYEQVDDPSFWDETMPPILFHYSISDYWALRVHEHGRLWGWLVDGGFVNAKP